MEKTALQVAGIVFSLVCLMHLLRLIFKVKVIVGEVSLPLWISAAGFIFSLALAVWMFKAAK